MPGIAGIVEQLLMATVVNGKILMPQKSKTERALTALSVIFTCLGVFFLVLSLYKYLQERYSPDIAALLSALLVLSIALLSSVYVHLSEQKKRRHMHMARHSIGKNIQVLIDDICQELDDPVRENPKTAVLLAALAGFFTANQTRH